MFNEKELETKARTYLEQYVEGSNDLLGEEVYSLFKVMLEAFYRNLRELYHQKLPEVSLNPDCYYEGFDRDGKLQKASFWLPLELLSASSYIEAVAIGSDLSGLNLKESCKKKIQGSFYELSKLYASLKDEGHFFEPNVFIAENDPIEVFFLTLLDPITAGVSADSCIIKRYFRARSSVLLVCNGAWSDVFALGSGQLRKFILGKFDDLNAEISTADVYPLSKLFAVKHLPKIHLSRNSFSLIFGPNEKVEEFIRIGNTSGVNFGNIYSLEDFLNGIKVKLAYNVDLVKKDGVYSLLAPKFNAIVIASLATRYHTIKLSRLKENFGSVILLARSDSFLHRYLVDAIFTLEIKEGDYESLSVEKNQPFR